MLPRLVSALDALAQLAHQRGGHRRCGPGRGARQRRGDQLALPHPALVGRRCITAFDVLLLLALQRFGMRLIEAVILLLVATIGVCYFIEIFVLPQTQPSFLEMGGAVIARVSAADWDDRTWRSASSARRSCRTIFTCTRHWSRAGSCRRTNPSIRRAIQFNTIDSVVALIDRASSSMRQSSCWRRWCSSGKTSVTVPGGEVVKFERRDSDWIRDRVPDACAAVGHGGGEHAVRGGAAGQRPEQHDHRHARRAGGDGRLHALADLRRGLRRLITRTLAILPAVFIIGCAATAASPIC